MLARYSALAHLDSIKAKINELQALEAKQPNATVMPVFESLPEALAAINPRATRQTLLDNHGEIEKLQKKLNAFPFIEKLEDVEAITTAEISQAAVVSDKYNLSLLIGYFLRNHQDELKIEALCLKIRDFIRELKLNEQELKEFEEFEILRSNVMDFLKKNPGQESEEKSALFIGFNTYEAMAEACFKRLSEKFIPADSSENLRRRFADKLKNIRANRPREHGIINDILDYGANHLRAFRTPLSTNLWAAIEAFIRLTTVKIDNINLNTLVAGIDNISFDSLIQLQTDSLIVFRIKLSRFASGLSSPLLSQEFATYLEKFPLPEKLQYFVSDPTLEVDRFIELLDAKIFSQEITQIKERSLQLVNRYQYCVEMMKELAVRLVRVHAIHALHQFMNPKKAYSGYVNYKAFMHYWHHSKTWLRYTGDEPILFKFVEDLYALDKRDIKGAIDLIAALLFRHKFPDKQGLHTNSFDTYLLQMLFNSGSPKGLAYCFNIYHENPDRLAKKIPQLTDTIASFEDYNFTDNKYKHDMGMQARATPALVTILGKDCEGLRGRQRKKTALERHSIFRISAVKSLQQMHAKLLLNVKEVTAVTNAYTNCQPS